MDIRSLRNPLFKAARETTVSAGVFPRPFCGFTGWFELDLKISSLQVLSFTEQHVSTSALDFSYMPPKHFCATCEQRHKKPTGRKCTRMATAADVETGDFYAIGHGCTSVNATTTTLTYSSSHLESSLAVTSFSTPSTTHTTPLSAPFQHPSTLQPTPRGVRFTPPRLPDPFS